MSVTAKEVQAIIERVRKQYHHLGRRIKYMGLMGMAYAAGVLGCAALGYWFAAGILSLGLVAATYFLLSTWTLQIKAHQMLHDMLALERALTVGDWG